MFVFDTSAFINGWRDHYRPEVFPGVWLLIAAAIEDGRVIVPREVFRELARKDDDVAAWAKAREGLFRDPSPDTQREAGQIYLEFPRPGIRDGADPFVLAEAKIGDLAVVTYEGRDFNGPTRNWDKKMPGICRKLGIDCSTLPVALGMLGGRW